MRTVGVLLAGVLTVAAVLVLPAPPAAACSCAGPPFEENPDVDVTGVDAYDAVFIGTVLGWETSGQETRWTFQIDSVVTGELATPIHVVTASDGAACGFESLVEGDQRAVGLTRRASQWESGLCSIDVPQSLDGIGDRRAPAVAEPPFDDGRWSSNRGWGLGLIGIGFGSILGAAIVVALLNRRERPTT